MENSFKTKQGLYEWLVMPFGLTNVVITFIQLMNHVLRPFIGQFMVVYFDDILIHSKSLNEHVLHLQKVFIVPRQEKLYANLKKCTYYTDHVTFLGFFVSTNRVQVYQEKLRAIREWPTPTNASQVQSFQSLMGFYRRFVTNFSTVAAPLIEVMKKHVVFHWSDSQEEAFNTIKDRLINPLVLAFSNSDKPLEVKCDASRVGIRAVLMQNRQPTALFSEKLSGATLNYPTYYK